MGKPATKRTAPFMVVMPAEEKDALFKAAEADGRSASNFALRLLRDGMKRLHSADQPKPSA